ncbi:Squalene/phytoene synthase [Rhodobacteraceae bacterium THAF1]|uniref:squalene/phytoene synthase family protein n=1 Tax=Palleronia sp. THAF1 TaxID=2587842 RepID=UPI000F402522|nr:squalene/phytoene synthase family protein [Palleronia sp. THAF1]QFU09200.1 Squalene/phytoene synthase [Palleronia sp. THAF1]VDC27310.1 Squalene/phytoene synthase [Rhodobacteraceae bacterium THAF1]
MTLNACAEIVKSGDADRFLAAMAAPPAARAVLFPIYAMNVEISRAPWVTAEPMIAEIRLQWWRDALAEIAAGQAPRRHEVVEPLAQVLDAEGARLLEPVIDTRRWEIAREPFVSEAQLLGHLAAGAGGLMWAAARTLGATDEDAVRGVGLAGGIAAWLVAVPAFHAAGLEPLPDASDDAIKRLAQTGLDALRPVGRAARPAALAAWEAGPVLKRAVAEPERVEAGTLARPDGMRRLRLMRMTSLGR